jgi:hypothetical protein
MRQASDMRETTWGFLQTGISELPVDYLGYAQTHLERFLTAAQSIEKLSSLLQHSI